MSKFNYIKSDAFKRDNIREMISLFRQYDINVKKDVDDFGYTAVMIAVCNRSNRILKYLLKHRGKTIINQKSYEGDNALDLAMHAGFKDTAIILLENGIEVSKEQIESIHALGWEDLLEYTKDNKEIDEYENC